MTFTATGLTPSAGTRATVDGDWEGVSTVAIQIGSEVKEYRVTLSTDNLTATLSSDDPHYWAAGDTVTVSAWWPYTKGEASIPTVVVQADQRGDGYAKSDHIGVAVSQTVTDALVNQGENLSVVMEQYLGFLPKEFCKAADKLTFKITLPIMLFLDMADVDMVHDFQPKFVLFCFGATLVSILVLWALARVLLQRLEGADVCLIRRKNGRLEPLFAVYGPGCLTPVRESLERGERSFVYGLFPRVAVRAVEEGELPGFDLERILCNVNRPEDWAAVRPLLQKRGGETGIFGQTVV